MMKHSAIALVASALLLAGCAGTPAPTAPPAPPSTAEARVPAGVDPFAPSREQTRVDSQGAIVVEVTPLNLEAGAPQLAFEVALNTHSVDLSMDLAPLATLTTDSGATVGASLWDARPGGHHVNGKLVFPSLADDGKAVLEGAAKLTLTIRGLEVSSRAFEWDLR